MIHRLILAIAASGLIFAAGCHHKCGHCSSCGGEPRPYLPPAPRTGSPFLLPPTSVPTTPVPGGAGAGVVPPVGPSDLRNYPPGRPAPEVLLPDTLPGSGSQSGASPGNSGSGFLGGPVNPQTSEPPVTGKGSDSPATGLSGYVRVKDGLATGRKPTLDGFDSLKQAGFRTVLYLHPAGADLSAVKDLASKRGLAFVAIETTPEKLADALDQFNAVVADKARHSIYVFDDDGVRTGAVWYLHFRTAEAMSDDVARVRARPLGLTNQGDEAKAFALATQRILETR